MADLLRFTVPGKPEYVGVVRLAVDLQPRIRQDSMLKISRILRSQFRKICTDVFCKCENTLTYQIVCEPGDDGIIISIDDGGMYGEKGGELQRCSELPDTSIPRRSPVDLAAGLLMLRALMDEVDIFSAVQERNMLIRMIKHFSRS